MPDFVAICADVCHKIATIAQRMFSEIRRFYNPDFPPERHLHVVQTDKAGVPTLGAGQLLSTAALREMTRQLGTSCTAEFLPNHVVARTRVVDTSGNPAHALS
jgi:hypothetical protein